MYKVRKAEKIRNRYSQVPHLTQDTTWEIDKPQLNITNKRQEVSPFPAGDHNAVQGTGLNRLSTALDLLIVYDTAASYVFKKSGRPEINNHIHRLHSGKSAIFRESNHGSGFCKEHYA